MNNVISLGEKKTEETIASLKEKLLKYELEDKLEDIRQQILLLMSNQVQEYVDILQIDDTQQAIDAMLAYQKKMEVFKSD